MAEKDAKQMQQAIERGKISLRKLSKKQQQQTCSICIDEIPVEYECELDCCEHKYCLPCITKWVQDVTNQCPLCKKKVHQLITRDALGRDVFKTVKNKKQKYVEGVMCERCHENLAAANARNSISVDSGWICDACIDVGIHFNCMTTQEASLFGEAQIWVCTQCQPTSQPESQAS